MIQIGKLNDFINIVNSKVGAGYVWGSQQDIPLTKEKLDWFVRTFGRQYYYFSNYSAEKWIGKEVYDCSGLVVYTLQKMRLMPANQDYAVDGLYYSLCTPVHKTELKAGDLCFVKTDTGIIHVGVYVGNGKVTHARSTFYGVCQTALFDSFNLFGRMKFFKDEQEINMSYEDIIKKVANNPDEWIIGINAIKAISANLGELDIFKYVPELLEKTYKMDR